jgi:hypothetical protein
VSEAPNQYVEVRDGGYYMAGTRIGLDVIAHDFQSGKAQGHPAKLSDNRFLGKGYGVITFILEHPRQIASYLADQERLWLELKDSNPLPPDLLERFMRACELLRKSA